MIRLVSICLCLLLLLSGCAKDSQTVANSNPVMVLIDPGHGGFDGGAVAEDGTYEKHINLSISLTLSDILKVCGVSVMLTRTTDQALNAEDSTAIRSNKISDMRARLALYQQANTVLSIHQNNFGISKYSGTQVFFSSNHSSSAILAGALQASIRNKLQPNNHRETKKATDGIYLLHHTTVPCALVECGFLSNPEEREKLKQSNYQQQMAFAIAAGYWDYILVK